MKKLTIAILFLLFLFVELQAQDVESWVKSKRPILFEKIYVHVDRELYAPGDIIWMKTYQVNGFTHQLNSNFRNVFVQLVAEDGRVVRDLMLLSNKGQANGQFKTDSLKDGSYTIRAYTKYLQNFGEDALFHKKIGIYKSMRLLGKTEKVQTDNSKIDVSFLPEGGNLVLNASNSVAFKAIDNKGRGIYVSGQIKNNRGDTITSFAASYLGMGKFILMPEEGASYYATIDRYPELKIQLPPAKANGICFNYREKDQSLMFEISTNMKLNNYHKFYFVASHKGTVLFYKKIEMVDYTQDIMVGKKLFPNGISKITLLDTALVPIAERLIFVDDGKDDLLSFRLNQKGFKPREEVKIDVDALLEPGDSITSTMSVAVVNKNYLSTGENTQNIKSYLLLDSDLKGVIESPASYFVNDKFHTSAEKLDLLMLVHGWRSYLWDDVEQTPQPSNDDWNDAGINISGYVKKLLWKAPLPNAELSMDYIFRFNNIGKATTDQNGRFLFKHTFFIDTLKVMINAHTKEGTRNLEIMIDPLPKKDSVVSVSLLKSSCFDIDLNMNFNRDNSFRQMKELEFNPEKGTILLEGIDVVDEKSKAFGLSFAEIPWADRTLTLIKDDNRFRNLVDYLVFNVPGFREDVDEMGNDILAKGRKEYSFMVNLSYRDMREFKTVRVRDVDRIDIWDDPLNPYGKILVYLKPSRLIPQYDDYMKGRIIPKLRGFDRPAIFYSPKYTLENINSPKPDFRPTLYWNPDVSIVNGKANLDFFTSDEATDYVVYLEGISKNGKICFGTTSFSVNKK
ncbi:MAG TPA: hypothetical protein VF373_12765 [Prolixibacteraceae bacterium]